jgi:hypothetical protein
VTELEELRAWLDRVNLPYVVRVSTFEQRGTRVVIVGRPAGAEIPNCTEVILGKEVSWYASSGKDIAPALFVPGDEEKAVGYTYFYQQFWFYPDGSLLESGTWE